MLREREGGGWVDWLERGFLSSTLTHATLFSPPTVATPRRSGGDDAYLGVLYPADDFVVYG